MMLKKYVLETKLKKLNLSITLIHNTPQILLHLILFKLNIT